MIKIFKIKKTIITILLLILILNITTSCTNNNTENIIQNTKENKITNNNFHEEIDDQEIKKYHEMLKPIIEEAIGKIIIKSYGTSSETKFIRYYTEKTLQNEDIKKIEKTLKKYNYEINSITTTYENKISFYIEEKTKTAQIVFDNNSNEIKLYVKKT